MGSGASTEPGVQQVPGGGVHGETPPGEQVGVWQSEDIRQTCVSHPAGCVRIRGSQVAWAGVAPSDVGCGCGAGLCPCRAWGPLPPTSPKKPKKVMIWGGPSPLRRRHGLLPFRR